MKAILIAALLIVAVQDARAEYGVRVLGNWTTSSSAGGFGDGDNFLAATSVLDTALAVRCLQRQLTVVVMRVGGDPSPFIVGKWYSFKFRVDQRSVVEAEGKVIHPRVIDVHIDLDFIRAIRDSNETAMRMKDAAGSEITLVFKTSGARFAFADISRECPQLK
jgi:hypothetical protein